MLVLVSRKTPMPEWASSLLVVVTVFLLWALLLVEGWSPQ